VKIIFKISIFLLMVIWPIERSACPGADGKIPVVLREPSVTSLSPGQTAIYVTETGEKRLYFNYTGGVAYVTAGDLTALTAGKQDDADTSSTDATRYWVQAQGYGLGGGDITEVAAGSGLIGGGISGGVSLAVSGIGNTHVAAGAAIAGTKIAPDFGSQNVVTMGSIGIGNTNPAYNLDVAGTFKANQTTTSSAVPFVFTRTASLYDWQPVVALGGLYAQESSAGNQALTKYATWDLADDRWESTVTSSIVWPIYDMRGYNIWTMYQGNTCALSAGDPITWKPMLSMYQNHVGIGVEQPASGMLTVQGHGTSSSTSGLVIQNSAGAELIRTNDAGYLAIGLTAPSSKVHVIGGVRADSIISNGILQSAAGVGGTGVDLVNATMLDGLHAAAFGTTAAVANKQDISDTATVDATRAWTINDYNGIRYRKSYSSLAGVVLAGADSLGTAGFIYGEPNKTDTVRVKYIPYWTDSYPTSTPWTTAMNYLQSHTDIVFPKSYEIKVTKPDTINAMWGWDNSAVFMINQKHNIVLDGGTISASPTTAGLWHEGDYFIMIQKSSNITIRNFTFNKPASDAIMIADSCYNILIENCTFNVETLQGPMNDYPLSAYFESSTDSFTGTNATVTSSSDRGAAGSAKSLKVVQTGSSGYASRSLSLSAGKVYHLQAHCWRANDGGNNPHIYIGTSPGLADLGNVEVDKRGLWQRVSSYDFSGTTVYITLIPALGSADKTAYFDVVVVWETMMIGRNGIAISPSEGTKCKDIRIINCDFKGGMPGCIDVEPTSGANCIENLTIQGCTFSPYDASIGWNGIEFTGSTDTNNDTLRNILIKDCNISGTIYGRYGVFFRFGTQIENVVFEKVDISDCYLGFYGDNVNNVKFKNCSIHDCKNDGVHTGARGMEFSGLGTSIHSLHWEDCSLYENENNGILFYGYTADKIYDIVLKNCKIFNNDAIGVEFKNCENFQVIGNQLYDDQGSATQEYGVKFTSDTRKGLIEHNVGWGNISSDFGIGTGTELLNYGVNNTDNDGKLVIGGNVEGTDPGSYNAVMTSHEIIFPSYRDALSFTAGAKISAIKRANWAYAPYNAWQSADLAFSTLGAMPGDEDDTVERMRIINSGLIGIGITEPVSALQVATNTNTAANPQSFIRIGPKYPQGSDPGQWGEVGRFGILFQGFRDSQYSGTIGAKIEAQNVAAAFGNAVQYTNILFSTLGQYASDGDDTVERMRIKYNGFVGVGITAPASRVHASGGMRADSLIALTTVNTSNIYSGSNAVWQTPGFLTVERYGSYAVSDLVYLNNSPAASRIGIIGNKAEAYYWDSVGGVYGKFRTGQFKSTGGIDASMVDSLNANLLDGHDSAYFLAKTDTGSSWFNASQLQGVRLNAANPNTNDVLKYNGSKWAPAALSYGDVVGPSAATSGMLAAWDGTTGKLLKNSNAYVDNGGQIGLGTTEPACLLTIKPTIDVGILVTKEAIPTANDSCASLKVSSGLGMLSLRSGTSVVPGYGYNVVMSVNNSNVTNFAGAGKYSFDAPLSVMTDMIFTGVQNSTYNASTGYVWICGDTLFHATAAATADYWLKSGVSTKH
jgi:hypothetical protein